MFSQFSYPAKIEEGIDVIEYLLTQDYELSLTKKDYKISRRSVALLLLQKDPFFWQEVQQQEPRFKEIEQVIEATQAQFEQPLTFIIAQSRHKLAAEIEKDVITTNRKSRTNGLEWLHQLTVNPITGLPILVLVLYFGIYQVFGKFGAGGLVAWLDKFFDGKINPVVNQVTAQILPWPIIQDLFANEYGMITLGIRYAIAIILPVVTSFFLMFSLLEDSGYLSRLSLLINRLFKAIGLSGRAVSPMVLGLGCGTIGTLVTHTMQTKKERLITKLLLALAIPCSTQLGVILGLLSQSPTALLIWGGFMVVIFLAVGFLSAQVLPGNQPCFYMEISPLRLPRPKAILTKTYFRLKWYFGEILPWFVFASVLIWLGKLAGLFDLLISGLKPVMLWLGLPPEAAPVFLYGFFRRDYGAAGMFDLQQHGVLNDQQLVVVAVTLTLFIPCIAKLQFMLKEQGVKTALTIAGFVLTFAFLMGYSMNQFMQS